MAKYRVTSPDGQTYEVTGPEGATDEQVLSQVKAYSAPKAAPASAPAAPPANDSTAGFIGGNLGKGVANLAGLPVDAITNAANLGIAGFGAATGRTPGLIEKPVGGSEWIQGLMRQGGMLPQAAEPQSAGGRYVAAALQALPSVAVGRPSLQQLPRMAGAAAASGVAGQAASDIGGPEWAGVGGMLPGSFSGRRGMGAGERATEARQGEQFGQAKELGIPIPPRELKADKPQQKLQNAINKELGQPEGAPLSPEVLKAYRDQHYGDYQAVIKEPALNGQITSTPAFRKAISNIATEERKLRTEFPNATKDAGLQQVLSDFVKPAYTTDGAMAQVQRLRESARNNLGSPAATDDMRRLGLVQRRIANAMEDLIGENVDRIGKPELAAKWKAARTAMAKAHDIEASLDPVTQKVNPSKLAALQTEGQPLSGQLKKIAEVTASFPGAVKTPKKDDSLFTNRVTPMAVTHPDAMAAHWMARLTDPMTMTGPYQRFIADPRSRLAPEQEMRLRALIGAQQANQGQIPPPP